MPDDFRILEARKGKLRLLPEPAAETPMLTYDGQVPGPLLRVKQGETVKIRLLNKLDQPTALHFQGVRLPMTMDGVAGLTQELVPPGGMFDYSFIATESGTHLYRPSLLANHAQQMARGLFGILVVDEPDPPPCDLDLTATLDNWEVDDKSGLVGAFNTLPDGGHRGDISKLVTLNGRTLPQSHTVVPGARIRLRLVNATIAMVAAIRFDGVRPMIVAIDGQYCDPFEPVRRTIPAGPGSRFELIFDLPAEKDASAGVVLVPDNSSERVLIEFKTGGEPQAPLPPIKRVGLNLRLPGVIRLQDAKRVEIILEPNLKGDSNHLWKINGLASFGLPQKPLFSLKAGTPVLLGFTNRSRVMQAMHVHGHNIRLLHDLDDGWEPYWRDNLLVEPGKTHHVAFIADNSGKWLIESLMLEDGRTGLATWFEVT